MHSILTLFHTHSRLPPHPAVMWVHRQSIDQ